MTPPESAGQPGSNVTATPKVVPTPADPPPGTTPPVTKTVLTTKNDSSPAGRPVRQGSTTKETTATCHPSAPDVPLTAAQPSPNQRAAPTGDVVAAGQPTTQRPPMAGSVAIAAAAGADEPGHSLTTAVLTAMPASSAGDPSGQRGPKRESMATQSMALAGSPPEAVVQRPTTIETTTTASASAAGSPGQGQRVTIGDMTTTGSSSLADPLLALAADTLDDLEGVRIANENRFRQLTRTEADADGEERGFGLDESHPDVARLASIIELLNGAERDATRTLERRLRAHPLGGWVKAQRGVGEKQAARLLAAIGDPYWHAVQGRPRTVQELWAYCGYHVVSPSTAPGGGHHHGGVQVTSATARSAPGGDQLPDDAQNSAVTTGSTSGGDHSRSDDQGVAVTTGLSLSDDQRSSDVQLHHVVAEPYPDGDQSSHDARSSSVAVSQSLSDDHRAPVGHSASVVAELFSGGDQSIRGDQTAPVTTGPTLGGDHRSGDNHATTVAAGSALSDDHQAVDAQGAHVVTEPGSSRDHRYGDGHIVPVTAGHAPGGDHRYGDSQKVLVTTRSVTGATQGDLDVQTDRGGTGSPSGGDQPPSDGQVTPVTAGPEPLAADQSASDGQSGDVSGEDVSGRHPDQRPIGDQGVLVGVAATRRRGQRANWSATAKSRAYLISASAVKQLNRTTCPEVDADGVVRHAPGCGCGWLRREYDAGRARYVRATHPAPCVRCGPRGAPAPAGSPLSAGHQHARALRLVSKALLRELWREARRVHQEARAGAEN